MAFFSNKNPSHGLSQQAVMDALSTVQDPDLRKDLVTLGMIKDVTIEGGRVSFTVELTTPACPLKDKIKNDCVEAVSQIEGVEDVEVNLSSQTTQRRPGEGKREIPGVKNIFAVSSGKGGVGKSTVAANLALALANSGAQVGLMDSDAYGPNIPQMMGVREHPTSDGQTITPPVCKGVKVMSVGLIAQANQAIVWRGPMLHSLIQQFLHNVQWGELDYLVVDMPPGTGDAQLSLSQQAPLSGVVMVTTPQLVSQSDVRRAIEMFRKVEVPTLGVIENMSYFICPDNNKHYSLFGSGGGESLAREYEVPFLGRIPIDPRIAEGGDSGEPIVYAEPQSSVAQSFHEIAGALAQQISIANAQNQPLPVIQ